MAIDELNPGDKIRDASELDKGDIITAGGVTADKKLVIETKEGEEGVFAPDARVVVKSFEDGEEMELEGAQAQGYVLTEADE